MSSFASRLFAALRSSVTGLAIAAVAAVVVGCGGGGGGGGDAGVVAPPGPAPAGFSIGGTVAGAAAGSGVTVSAAGATSLLRADGAFTLARGLATGTAYKLRAQTSATDKRCTVQNAQGTVNAADVTNIAIDCSLGQGWVTDGRVLASALSSDGRTLFIGGRFSRVASPSGSFVRIDPASARLLDVPDPVRGVVAAAGDGQGGVYLTLENRLGAEFESPVVYTMVRLDAEGRRSSFPAADLGGPATGLRRVGDTLFVTGLFRLPGSATTQRIAALDANTGALRPWRAAVSGNVVVWADQGNTLFVVRDVIAPSGAVRATLGAVDVNTGAVRDWAPDFGEDSSLALALVRSGDSLIVAGGFNRIDGVRRDSIAAFDTTTLALRDWAPAPRSAGGVGSVARVTASDSTVYVAGRFTEIGGASRNGLAALSTATALALDWQAPAVTSLLDTPANVGNLTLYDDSLILTGSFSKVGGQPRAGLAAVSASDGRLLDHGTVGDVSPSLVIGSGPRLWAGGFTLAGGVKRTNIAAIDVRTGQATNWQVDLGPVVGGEGSRDVYHLLTLGDKLLIAGAFDTVAGEARQNIAAVDAATGRLLPWTASLGPSTFIRQLVAQGSSAYVVGDFRSWAGQARAGVVRLDTGSLGLQGWSIQAPTDFAAVAVAPAADRVYVAGGPSGAAAFDAGTGVQIPWDPRLSSLSGGAPRVRDIVAAGGAVYLTGQDLVVPGAGILASGVRIDPATGTASRWLSDYGSLSRLFFTGGQLLASRCSISVDVATRCAVSEFDASTGAERAVLADLDTVINTLSADELSVYAGGDIGLGNTLRQNLVFFGR